MKGTRLLSLIISVIFLFSLTVPVFAAETETMGSPLSGKINADATDEGMIIEQIGNAVYYKEKANTYSIVIGIYDTVVDCTLQDYESGMMLSGILPISQISATLSKRIIPNSSESFQDIRNAILGGKIELHENVLQNSSSSYFPPTRASSTEKAKIMEQLYAAGWPQAYSNYLRQSMTQNGVTANLYHTLSYNIRDYDYTFVAAQTALSALMTITGLGAISVKEIISFAITADGIWKTVKDINVGKFDTFAYEDKYVRIDGNQSYYMASRTVKWTAVIGDIGTALTFDYENASLNFFDNTKMLEIGLQNYFNG